MAVLIPVLIPDQATGLRQMTAASLATPVRAIAVTGGKGGVGKTNVSVNLAIAAAEAGHRVMVFDADLGLANIDVVLGLHPKHDLSDFLEGRCELSDVIIEGPSGIRIIPGASGVKGMAELSTLEHTGLIRAFADIGQEIDTFIIDTAAGISDTVISFSRAAHEILVVVCDEPASITDAYALIKLMNRDYGTSRFRLVSNMVSSPQEGRELYNKMCRVTDRYLDVMLSYMGSIPYDMSLKKAVKTQKPVIHAYPRSKAAQAFRGLARRLDDWPQPSGASGQVQFFVERLIQYNSEAGGSLM